MESQAFVEHVEDLTDLELAVLLSLVAQQHCMVVVKGHLLDDLASELALVRCEHAGVLLHANVRTRSSETCLTCPISSSIKMTCNLLMLLVPPSWMMSAMRWMMPPTRLIRTSIRFAPIPRVSKRF